MFIGVTFMIGSVVAGDFPQMVERVYVKYFCQQRFRQSFGLARLRATLSIMLPYQPLLAHRSPMRRVDFGVVRHVDCLIAITSRSPKSVAGHYGSRRTSLLLAV